MAKKKVDTKLEMVEQYNQALRDIKRFGLLGTFFVLIITVVSGFIVPNPSYALLTTDPIPDSFTSTTTEVMLEEIGTISIPASFTGTYENGSLSDIYCIEHRLNMASDIVYSKGASVLTDYPGLVYILENNNFNTGNANLNHYLTQITIWWYLDRVNGYDNDKNYIGPTEVWDQEETLESDKYNDQGEYRFYNNLSVLDKQAINNDELYGPMITDLVLKALDYTVPETTLLNVTNASSVTYHIVGDYLETSDIAVTSNDNLVSYEVVADTGSNVEIVDSAGVAKTTFSANETFRLRISMSALENNHADLNVHITGTFKRLNGYVYQPDDSNAQRVVLGQAQNETLSDYLDLDYDLEMGTVIVHKQDAQTGEQIAGATLVITDSQGVQVAKFTTSTSPEELVLPVGNYTITETIVPDNYNVETTTYDFAVTKDTTIEVTVKNTKEIVVPDTAMDAAVVYGIGASIIIIGVILIIIAVKPQHDKKK